MKIHEAVLSWYNDNGRDLPWNKTRDPYHIWISEIILQQTRVETALNYYERFVTKWPRIEDLASATEEEVLKMWQGLGYYSRARNVHKTAKYITENRKGKMPDHSKELIELPGIGPYTAAAIASFAFEEPICSIDGNVHRVLSRYFFLDLDLTRAKERRQLQKMANGLLPRESSNWNRALMGIGNRICQPQQPDCPDCPLQDSCQAFAQKELTKYPIKKKKIAQKKRYFHYLWVVQNGKVLLRQRKQSDIWKGLFELPLIELSSKGENPKSVDSWTGLSGNDGIRLVKENLRILSHQQLYIKFYQAKGERIIQKSSTEYHWLYLEEMKQKPFPKSIADFINEIR